MWAMIKRQLIRNLFSVRILIIIAASAVLIFFNHWSYWHAGFMPTASAPTFLREVMLFSRDGSSGPIYLLLLPFFAALIGGSVFSIERFTGRINSLYTRKSRNSVLRGSMISGFLLGGIGGTMPLLLNLLVAAVRDPHMTFIDGVDCAPDAATYMTEAEYKAAGCYRYILIDSKTWLYDVYKTNQVLLIVTVLLMVFLISGLFATLAVGVSFFTKKRFVELLIPFVVSLVWWALPDITLGAVPNELSHVTFLNIASAQSATGGRNYSATGFVITVLGLAFLSWLCVFVERKCDVS